LPIAHGQPEQIFSGRKINGLPAGKRLLQDALVFLRLSAAIIVLLSD